MGDKMARRFNNNDPINAGYNNNQNSNTNQVINSIQVNADKQAKTFAQQIYMQNLRDGQAQAAAQRKAQDAYQQAFDSMVTKAIIERSKQDRTFALDIEKMRYGRELDVGKAQELAPIDIQKATDIHQANKKTDLVFNPEMAGQTRRQEKQVDIDMAPEVQAAAPFDPLKDPYARAKTNMTQLYEKSGSGTLPITAPSKDAPASPGHILQAKIQRELQAGIATSKDPEAIQLRTLVEQYGNPANAKAYYKQMAKDMVTGSDPTQNFFRTIDDEANPGKYTTTLDGKRVITSTISKGTFGGQTVGKQPALEELQLVPWTERNPNKKTPQQQISDVEGFTSSAPPEAMRDPNVDPMSSLGAATVFKRLVEQGKSPESAFKWAKSMEEMRSRDKETPESPQWSEWYQADKKGKAPKEDYFAQTGSPGFQKAQEEQAEWKLTGRAPGWFSKGNGDWVDQAGNTYNPNTRTQTGGGGPEAVRDWFVRPFDEPGNYNQMAYANIADKYGPRTTGVMSEEERAILNREKANKRFGDQFNAGPISLETYPAGEESPQSIMPSQQDMPPTPPDPTQDDLRRQYVQDYMERSMPQNFLNTILGDRTHSQLSADASVETTPMPGGIEMPRSLFNAGPQGPPEPPPPTPQEIQDEEIKKRLLMAQQNSSGQGYDNSWDYAPPSYNDYNWDDPMWQGGY